MPKPSIVIGAAAIIVALAACQRDYRFHTVAVYGAPRGGYVVRIDGAGLVRAGHDVSSDSRGTLTVSPAGATGPGGRAPAEMNIALNGNGVHLGHDSPDEVSSSERNARSMSDMLTGAGHAVHPDELEELLSAIEGVLSGPKGTRMPGQTKALTVVSVRFDP